MSKTAKMEAGSKFLPGRSVRNLQEMHKKEKDPKAVTLLLVCIMRKKGMSIRAICTTLNKSYSTIRNWLVRISKGGFKRRYDKKKPGSQSRMNPDQLKDLRADVDADPQQCGFTSGAWIGPLVAIHIEKKSTA